MQASHLLLHQRDESAQGFPLAKLADALLELEYLLDTDQVVLSRVWGGGDVVFRWDEETEVDSVRVSVVELLEVIRDANQWFYDLDVSLPPRHFRFGVFDSSFPYFEGPDDMVQSLKKRFPEGKSASGALPF